MKVCFVTTSFIRSRDDHYARFVYEQAKCLVTAEAATAVVIVAPHAAGLAPRECVDGLEIRRARYFWPLVSQRLAYQHEGLFETVRRSWAAIAQVPFFLSSMLIKLWGASRGARIIHAQWVPTAALAVVVGRLRRVPVVVSVRGADLNTAQKSALGRRLTRLVIDRVDHVVTVSDEFKEMLLAEIGCRKPVSALYNGVDTAQFRPRSKSSSRSALGLLQNGKVALYVGGLIRRKGVDVLVEALASQSKLRSELTLYLVGDGPQRAALQDLVSARDLDSNVRFVGSVSKDKMHWWMNAADMLILPSHSEGRPNVVLEALASGTPVIATAVNGTSEVIVDGDDGLLFPAGDVAQLASCITRLLTEPSLSAKLSARGPRRIQCLGLTWPAHGQRLMTIYRNLLS